VHHTDRGCQYASREYRELLERQGVTCSMSELGHGCAFETRTEAYDAISDYIETYYNPKRRHSAAGNLSPNDDEIAHVGDLPA
jgi:putative transposase